MYRRLRRANIVTYNMRWVVGSGILRLKKMRKVGNGFEFDFTSVIVLLLFFVQLLIIIVEVYTLKREKRMYPPTILVHF